LNFCETLISPILTKGWWLRLFPTLGKGGTDRNALRRFVTFVFFRWRSSPTPTVFFVFARWALGGGCHARLKYSSPLVQCGRGWKNG